MIEDHYRACGRQLLKLNKCHDLLHRPQRRSGGLAYGIFGPTIHMSS